MDKTLILNKLQKHYKFKKDNDFALFLGISGQLLSKWKLRNTFDVDVLYTKCTEISPDFLLSGNEPIQRIDVVSGTSEIDKVYKDLSESRLEVINGLKFKIAALEKTISDMRYARSETFLHTNVAEPAPELTGKKRK